LKGSRRGRATAAARELGKEGQMGLDDKIENKTEDVGGKAKEAAGKATDNERLEAEGKNDQSKADVKQAGEKVKDAFKH
jgi:uncharacterized protein YjbJ (UPF0337 family)